MNLIDLFESKPFQDVGTFNAIFKAVPLLNYPSSTPVEIKELTPGGARRVLVGSDELFIDLSAKSIGVEVKRAPVETKLKTKRLLHRKKGMLPEVYRKLSSSEFMIYSAVKELEEVHGVEELSRNIALTSRTIRQCLPRLVELGFVRTEKASTKDGHFLKISVDV